MALDDLAHDVGLRAFAALGDEALIKAIAERVPQIRRTVDNSAVVGLAKALGVELKSIYSLETIAERCTARAQEVMSQLETWRAWAGQRVDTATDEAMRARLGNLVGELGRVVAEVNSMLWDIAPEPPTPDLLRDAAGSAMAELKKRVGWWTDAENSLTDWRKWAISTINLSDENGLAGTVDENTRDFDLRSGVGRVLRAVRDRFSQAEAEKLAASTTLGALAAAAEELGALAQAAGVDATGTIEDVGGRIRGRLGRLTRVWDGVREAHELSPDADPGGVGELVKLVARERAQFREALHILGATDADTEDAVMWAKVQVAKGTEVGRMAELQRRIDQLEETLEQQRGVAREAIGRVFLAAGGAEPKKITSVEMADYIITRLEKYAADVRAAEQAHDEHDKALGARIAEMEKKLADANKDLDAAITRERSLLNRLRHALDPEDKRTMPITSENVADKVSHLTGALIGREALIRQLGEALRHPGIDGVDLTSAVAGLVAEHDNLVKIAGVLNFSAQAPSGDVLARIRNLVIALKTLGYSGTEPVTTWAERTAQTQHNLACRYHSMRASLGLLDDENLEQQVEALAKEITGLRFRAGLFDGIMKEMREMGLLRRIPDMDTIL